MPDPASISQIRYHQDPGHGWYEIPMANLRHLKVDRCISPYSYIRGNSKTGTAYIEEDLDAETLIAALKAAGQIEDRNYTVIDCIDNNNSFIRKLRMYPAVCDWRERREAFLVSIKSQAANA